MNPDENNPLANPGVPDFSSANPADIPSGVTNNNPTMGNFAPVDSAMGDNTSIMNTMDSAAPAMPTIDEPLTPAAPVPGSIGSAMSGPAPTAEPMANPFAPAADAMAPNTNPVTAEPATNATPSPAAPAADTTPAATDTPAPAPYNPFAAPKTDSTPTPAPQSAISNQTPVAKLKNHAQNHLLTIILGALSAIFLITTIIFLALYINAKNNPKIVYMPPKPEDDSNSRLQILTCSAQGEEVIESGELAPTTSVITATYVGGKISGLMNEMTETFPTAEQAISMRDVLLAISAMDDYQYRIEQSIEDTTLKVTFRPVADPLTDEAAANFIYSGEEITDQSVAIDDVEAYYVSQGASCTMQ